MDGQRMDGQRMDGQRMDSRRIADGQLMDSFVRECRDPRTPVPILIIFAILDGLVYSTSSEDFAKTLLLEQ